MRHPIRLPYIAAVVFLLIAALPYVALLRTHKHRETPSGKSAEILSIISPHRREERIEFERGFKEWMRTQYSRSVDIRWLDVGGTSKILKDLESRFETTPDSPGVDVFFGGGVAPYMTASDKGWLEAVEISSNVLAGVPPTCAGSAVYDPAHKWFGVALSGFGILFNKPVLQRLGMAEPRNWDDLGKPEYFSWLASGDPRSSGSVHVCYEIVLQACGFGKGWGLITRICANVRGFGESSAVTPREVASGEVAAGMIVDMSARTEIDAVGGDSLVFVLPRGTTIISPDSIAAIKGGNHELSRLFIEYTLTPDGQRLLFQPAGVNGQTKALHRMPVVERLYGEAGAPETNPYSLPQALRYDGAKGSRRNDVLNDLMGVWLIDAQSDLKRAWKKIIDKGCPAALVDQLCAPPVSEEALMALAAEWKNPRRRQEVMKQWADEARQRYAILAGASE
jgi:ABC-type Fe3+ transport system substrate-binding protein